MTFTLGVIFVSPRALFTPVWCWDSTTLTQPIAWDLKGTSNLVLSMILRSGQDVITRSAHSMHHLNCLLIWFVDQAVKSGGQEGLVEKLDKVTRSTVQLSM